MAEFSQERRTIAVNTPLGKDALLLVGFTGHEELSQLFHFQLDMLSTDDAIDPKAIVGKNVTVAIQQPEYDHPRYFNGVVCAFRYRGRGDRLSMYRAEVVPWLWLLTRTSNCRIFQDKKVPEIIEQIFNDRGMADFDMSGVSGDHPKREYCVQYRETDFNFVCRLMEEEGIHFHFKHEDGKHKMVLSDQKSSYYDCDDSEVSLRANLSAPELTDKILAWEHQFEFRSGKWAHKDYNFKTPKESLTTKENTIVQLDENTKYELFDYPGLYNEKGVGQKLAKARIEEEEAPHDVVEGASRCRSFSPGGKFKITKHHHASEEGKSFVITAVSHSVQISGYVPGEDQSTPYQNSFRCIPAETLFRPRRATPKPRIHGNQTAFVVGPSGDEIHTDEYGRVKVLFHWDRDNKADDTASCWIRVMQPWAGPNWGFIFLPRIGHEVVVSFLEGDPDRPLITGSVYNHANKPPYTLPDMKTISGIKTLSSTGGDGFNEIRFEDKKGEEQLFIHAEKNQDIRTKNDSFENVGNEQHLTVTANQFVKIEANRHELVGADHLEEIEKDRHLKVKGKEAKAVGGSRSLKVGGDAIYDIGGNHNEKVTGNFYVKAAGVVIEGTAGITLKCGGNSVVIDAAGVTVKGTIVCIDGGMTMINSGPLSVPSAIVPASAVAPTKPTEPKEADEADPGKIETVKAEQRDKGTGKYGSTPAPPFVPGKGIGTDEYKKSWIEIKLLDQDGEPVAGEPYQVKLPDGTLVASGALDEKGFARIEGCDPGTCKVIFPMRDKSTWRAKG